MRRWRVTVTVLTPPATIVAATTPTHEDEDDEEEMWNLWSIGLLFCCFSSQSKNVKPVWLYTSEIISNFLLRLDIHNYEHNIPLWSTTSHPVALSTDATIAKLQILSGAWVLSYVFTRPKWRVSSTAGAVDHFWHRASFMLPWRIIETRVKAVVFDWHVHRATGTVLEP